MLLIIILILVALVLLAILSSMGRRKTEDRTSRVAAANHERIKREAPSSTYASMGPNEFLEEYNRFLKRRAFKIFGICFSWVAVLALIWFQLYPSQFYYSPFSVWAIIWFSSLVPVFAYALSTGGRYPKWPQK
ncbi:hypothetical protein [uncultured Parvibaculum sp.]|jgi:uncharacterized membrane protein|uniref:hypothetical protein n=1 Tax=uncultured Parvibaculum sp. TaxID=291828 RepID=UPI0030DCFAD1|tara:strand:- start:65645 stop:66043 length:399 start_codon:yes stop_codon:yes gene_type:complete